MNTLFESISIFIISEKYLKLEKKIILNWLETRSSKVEVLGSSKLELEARLEKVWAVSTLSFRRLAATLVYYI
jgi:hypothetical protein